MSQESQSITKLPIDNLLFHVFGIANWSVADLHVVGGKRPEMQIHSDRDSVEY